MKELSGQPDRLPILRLNGDSSHVNQARLIIGGHAIALTLFSPVVQAAGRN